MAAKHKHTNELPKRSSNFELEVPPLFWRELREAQNRGTLPIDESDPIGRINEDVVAKIIERLSRSVTVRFTVDSRGPPKIASVIVEPKRAPKIGDDLQHALAAARERGQHRVAEILRSDDMLGADAFASLLNTTRMTINTKRKKHQVLALEGATRGFRFPRWQIGQDGKPFSALPALFKRLGNDSWAVYRFLVQHHPELDGLAGREALQRGMSLEAIDAAESVARNTA